MNATIDFLIKLAESAKVKAWGEIGLDFNRMYSPREDQERWFVKQLEVVGKLDLPTIFHERDSQGRFLEILNAQTDKTRKGVVHCFSGNTEELEQYLDHALNSEWQEIRIIHGKGTGALRNKIHAYLKRNKKIKSYRLGNYGEGDTGVTVIKL